MYLTVSDIRRRPLPKLSRIDGRSGVARRVKVVSQRLKREIDLRRRWSNIELDLLKRTAWSLVLAEEASCRALDGSLPVSDCIKAQGAARRAELHLKKSVKPREDEPVSYDDLMEVAS